MVNEIDRKSVLTTEEILRREHAASSGSRKTVDGPLTFKEHDTEARIEDPTNVAVTDTTANMDMDFNTAYRLIANVDMHFRLSKGASTATTSDVYLPANQAMIIQSGRTWDKVNVIKATGAADGVAQIMPLK